MTYYWYRLGQALIRLRAQPDNFRLAERIADWYCRYAADDRAILRANLSLLLKEPVADRSALVCEVFRNFARYLVEFFSVHRLPPSALTVEGAQEAVARCRAHRGGIVLSAHIGNWELGSIILRRLGLPVSVVALPHADARVNRLFDLQRQRCGVRVIPVGVRATARCVERLRQGGVLGLAGDREFGQNGLEVDCFGHRVALPRGPALLSLRTGVPVIPVFFIRQGPWRFQFYTEPPIWPPRATGSLDAVQQLSQRYANAIERIVQRFPTQWLMFQRMAPVGEAAAAAAHPIDPETVHVGSCGRRV